MALTNGVPDESGTYTSWPPGMWVRDSSRTDAMPTARADYNFAPPIFQVTCRK